MYCDPQQFDGTPALLYHNNRDGTFTEVGRKAGVANPAGKGLGCKVRVTSGSRTQLREINLYGSYLSTSDVRLFFGLGGEATITRLEIEWPSGKKQVIENVRSGQVLLDEADARR